LPPELLKKREVIIIDIANDALPPAVRIPTNINKQNPSAKLILLYYIQSKGLQGI
jgi:hypothetical protein